MIEKYPLSLKYKSNIIITNYRFDDIGKDNFEEFITKLFNGLKHYEKKDKSFKFELSYSKKGIELKVIKLNESVN